jgi:hypothetical protein
MSAARNSDHKTTEAVEVQDHAEANQYHYNWTHMVCQ